MKQHQFMFWSAGGSLDSAEAKFFAQRQPRLLPPARLREAAVIQYQWGQTQFEIAALCCSLRVLPWRREQITWLHCKAAQTVDIKEGTPFELMTVLIAARNVTSIAGDRAIRFGSMKGADRTIGVFAPTQPPLAGALALTDIEAFLSKLLAPVGAPELLKEPQ